MSQLTLNNQDISQSEISQFQFKISKISQPQFKASTQIEIQAQEIAPEIRVDSDPDADFGTFYRLWHGTNLLGTFYHALDGKWVAQPCNSDDRPRCNTAVEAQLLIMASENAFLRRQLKRHEICPVFNVLTRASLEDRWESAKQIPNLAIAFLDVDKLKEANSRWGQYESSRRLAEAFALARHNEIIGRFYLGDELIILAPIDEIRYPVERIMKALTEREMSATVAIAPYRGQESLKDATKEVNEKVEELKSRGERGVVVWVEAKSKRIAPPPF